jgi:hypothetical protein
MRARELELLLGEWTPRSKSDLDIRMRKLREARLLPIGGRGPYAPEVGPREAATVLIAICASRQAVDAADAVRVFASLRPKFNDEAFEGAGTLSEALAAALASPAAAKRVAHILFSLPGRFDEGFSMGYPFCAIRCRNAPQPYYYVTEQWLNDSQEFYDSVKGAKPSQITNPTRKRRPLAVVTRALTDTTELEGSFIVELSNRLRPKPSRKAGPRKKPDRRSAGRNRG